MDDKNRKGVKMSSSLAASLIASMLVLAISGVAITVPTAQAHEGEEADDCVGYLWTDPFYGETCFEVDGDDQWVYDGDQNGWRVGVNIATDYGKIRHCENTHGEGTWHECTFNHDEDGCVSYQLYERDADEQNGGDGEPDYHSPWSPWISIRTGAPC
jgi:hypothetical protein